MKSGTCPKCGRREVYCRQSSQLGSETLTLNDSIFTKAGLQIPLRLLSLKPAYRQVSSKKTNVSQLNGLICHHQPVFRQSCALKFMPNPYNMPAASV